MAVWRRENIPGDQKQVTGPMFAMPPNYHEGRKPRAVHPFPLPPMIPNRRKGQAWYHDPNRK